MSNPIEMVAASIQRMPGEVRWVYADEAMVAAVATGASIRHGARTRRIARLLALAGRLGLARAAAAALSLTFAAKLYLKQSAVSPRGDISGALFVGIGALREAELVPLFERAHGAVHVVDERDFRAMGELARVGFGALLREWRLAWKSLRSCLSVEEIHGVSRQNALVNAVRHAHLYAYYRALFAQYFAVPGHSRSVGFTASSPVAFGAIAAGADAALYVHGFQARAVIYPDFKEVHCFNRFEAAHFRARLPAARVDVIPQLMSPIETRRVLAIAVPYVDLTDIEHCESLIHWARSRDIPVVLRRHPYDRAGYCERWRGVEGVEVFDRSCSFEEFVQTVRPRILGSWTSTVLLDCLKYGIVPLTMRQEAHELVFPFRDIAICWPDQMTLLQSIADDPKACLGFAKERFAVVSNDGVAPSPAAFDRAGSI